MFLYELKTEGLSLQIEIQYVPLQIDKASTVASSNPGRSGGRIFFSRVNFVC